MATHIQFNYVNWRQQDHTYLVIPEKVEFARYDDGGASSPLPHWVLHAKVFLRDGEERPQGVVRRTFLLHKIRDIREVERGH